MANMSTTLNDSKATEKSDVMQVVSSPSEELLAKAPKMIQMVQRMHRMPMTTMDVTGIASVFCMEFFEV
jgi:hypothetical protein